MMQEETFSLKQQISYHQEKHNSAYNRVEAVVDRMIDLYEQAEKNILTGKDHQQVITDMNEQLLALRPLKTMRQHFVHYYRKLSSLIRKLQNGNKNTNTALSRFSKRRQSNGLSKEQKNNERFKKYFSSFITEDSQKQDLQKMIVEHFLREGKFECVKVWEKEVQQLDRNNLFYECHKIKDKIKKGHFYDAIVWCQSQRLYETRQCLLQYELVKLDLICLVDKGRSSEALSYYMNKMPRYCAHRQEQIQKLMGFILFRSDKYWANELENLNNLGKYCNQRYNSFVFNQEKCEQIAQLFVKEYLKHNNINQFDVFKIVYNCSKKISQQYQRLMSLTWESEGKADQRIKYNNQLPFSIKLDNSYQYHSLFLCPVNKQVHSSGEPTVLLSCGHMISKGAQDRIIQESRNRRRVKCPICQKDIHPEDSISVEY